MITSRICEYHEYVYVSATADEGVCGQASELKHICPSLRQQCSAVYIEGVFYEDQRVSGWQQGALGRPIVAWAKERKRKLEAA